MPLPSWETIIQFLGGGSALIGAGVAVFLGLKKFAVLEERLQDYRAEQVSLRDKWRAEVKELTAAEMAVLRAGFKLEVDSFKSDVEGMIEDARPTARDWPSPNVLKEMLKRISQLEIDIHRLRRSDTKFVKRAEIDTLVKELQEQWRELERTLGQIEGKLGK